jgi:hypothetical protein
MNGVDIAKVLRRLKVHLGRHQYEACHSILEDLEADFNKDRRLSKEHRDELECIASLPIEQRLINILEREGYIYVNELDGVDILNLSIKQLGTKGKRAIYNAVKEARRQLEDLCLL